jgi:hypothetical protein
VQQSRGDIITFSNDTTSSVTTADIPPIVSGGRFGQGAISNGTTEGFICGGTTSATGSLFVNTCLTVQYATDVTALGSQTLSSIRSLIGTVSDCYTKGYYLGGQSASGTNVNTADMVTFSTRTIAAQTSANLPAVRSAPGTVNNYRHGYIGGGNTGARVTSCVKAIFAGDVCSAMTQVLSVARDVLAGASDGMFKGYFSGGQSATNGRSNATDKITFSTDAIAAATSANLSSARQQVNGVSSGSIACYFVGGATGSSTGYVVTADKVTFANDISAAATTANLSLARGAAGAMSDVGL